MCSDRHRTGAPTGGFRHLVRPAKLAQLRRQLTVLRLELDDALRIRAGRAIGDVGVLDPLAHRLDPIAELSSDSRDRSRLASLSTRLAHQTNRLILLSIGVPARRRLPR